MMRRHPKSLRIKSLCLALLLAVEPCLWAAQSVPAPDKAIPPSLPENVTEQIQRAIDRGLRYLAQSQGRDGGWRSKGVNGSYPTAMTALAGLALLSSGSTPTEGPYARNVSAAISFLLRHARQDGLIALLEEESNNMHGHGFAMLFLAECYGMEEDPTRRAQIGEVLARAIKLTGQSQSAAGGWLYTPDAGGDEGSVTVTQVQAFRAALNAGVAVPKRVIDQAMQYLEDSRNPDGGIRYQVSSKGASRPPITAAAIVCWYNAGHHDDPEVQQALRFVEAQLRPSGDGAGGHFFYAHLYMAQAMYLSGDDKWQPYYHAIARRLLGLQGSDGAWDGDYVGTVYGTAVATIILQMPYKHLPVMQR